MADPACGADPSLHESRRRGESFKAWRVRLVQARQVCRGCELFAPCLELLDDVRAGRVQADGYELREEQAELTAERLSQGVLDFGGVQ